MRSGSGLPARAGELIRACPRLGDLELLATRTRGDEAEAGVYCALSGLRQLDRLSLLL